MSSLMASRWVATPEPDAKDENTNLSSSNWVPSSSLRLNEPSKKNNDSSLFTSRWADTPPLEESDQKDDEGKERLDGDAEKSVVEEVFKNEAPVRNGDSNNTAKESVDLGAINMKGENVGALKETLNKASPEMKLNRAANSPTALAENYTAPSSPLKSRLAAPRLRKKVSYGKKHLVISIPDLDYDALGFARPLSFSEVEARLEEFERAGYSTGGFDLLAEDDSNDDPVHVKPIYPDEEDSPVLKTHESAKVRLPDLNKWEAYMDWLTEQKLAALGVSISAEEPAGTPLQEMSRQASGQYSAAPFSPPIPSNSASSMGRPRMVRGHSHTMSMASPISPLNGPYGHMHRHSTFSGPISFQQVQLPNQPPAIQSMRAFSPQGQPPLQQAAVQGLQSFSPQHQFALPGFSRTGSPAQVAGMRNDLGGVRGPSSPLSQHVVAKSSQDYNRILAEDQLRRHWAYPQSAQPPSLQNAFVSQVANVQPHPTLPELPEDDDEGELLEQSELENEPEPETDRPAYVPPHKRAQLNANIALPTPRGHRHNISEGLERDILEAEKRHEVERQNWIEVDEDSGEQSSKFECKSSRTETQTSTEKDPLFQHCLVQETSHTHKRSASRFNVAAPSFQLNLDASFRPTPSAFTFGVSDTKSNALASSRHSRQQSSGTFNVAAPVFKPSGPHSLPKSEFSFSTNGPSFKPDAPSFEPKDRNAAAAAPAIFGKVNIPDIVKPARRSKAVPIQAPTDSYRRSLGSGTEHEDEEGRIAQSDDRLKRQRKTGDDGNDIPQFAEPNPVPPSPSNLILKPRMIAEEVARSSSAVGKDKAEPSHDENGTTQEVIDTSDVFDPVQHGMSRSVDRDVHVQDHKHKHSSSLSALARPFEPVFPSDPQTHSVHHHGPSSASISDLEGELREEEHPTISPLRSREPSAGSEREEHRFPPILSEPAEPLYQPASARVDNVALGEPSFDEIDAVIRQLNEAEDERNVQESPEVSLPPSPGAHPMQGVTYLPQWSRSDAPSPSPQRQRPHLTSQADSSFTVHDRTNSGEHAVSGFPHINRLNKAEDLPTSDWSGEFSATDEEKLNQQGYFFDSHIDDLVGRAVEKRLQPMEESLRSIHSAVNKRPTSRDLAPKRSSSAVESDADDEDEMSEEQRHRPISRGRDKRVDQIKAAVMEALREQSPQRRSQSSHDIQELHSVLADMKMSFARAASEGLKLEEVRAVVENVVGKQSQALVPIDMDEGQSASIHKREMPGLKHRLNDTLASALEEANNRRAAEEREAETRRMLRLAEEELQLVRDSSRDERSRVNAAEHDREDLLCRVEEAKDSQRNMDEKIKDLEAENAATYATLEEYRMSSHKWRQDIDQSTREREDLEKMITELERQLEQSQESSGSMRRRLEKLHSDMATATGQLASEKATWRAKEEDYRAESESLETQVAAHSLKRSELEEELHNLQASAKEASDARLVLDQTRTSKTSLDEMVSKLQTELLEQQSLAARFERDFNHAREAGRAEVHRTRMSMETDLEAANHQVNVVRAEVEAELSKVRSEHENLKIEAETAKACHERILEEQDDAKREALRKVNKTNSIALDEARQKHEASVQEFQAAHKRALDHALEDKQRSEHFLNERLSLSDAKLQHFQDKVLHLEERLEVAKSAAQAAAMNAQSRVVAPVSSSSTALPEKVSPQALRESILVLQEQLQDRESQIDKLQNQADTEGPVKLKKRDDEIAWLRELLANRNDELTDLVNTLAQATFDRGAVRNTAIRIRANLQMEQQEKQRLDQNSQSLPGQAIASLSSFATPKATQLSTAFSKWRSTMESSALKDARRPNGRPRSSTPSKPSASTTVPPGYMSGLMTPPASNLRTTPSPEAAESMPPSGLHSRRSSKSNNLAFSEPPRSKSRHPSASSQGPNTPLFRSQSYDEDADDRKLQMESFEEGVEDETLDIAENGPSAFQSLEDELENLAGDDSLA